MLNPKRILLASHGTPGARAAESAALALGGPETLLYHLVVVPDLWKGMMATDWRNPSSVRNDFAEHLENELDKEICEHRDRIRQGAEGRGMRYEFTLAQGDPAGLLLEHSRRQVFDLIVVGAPRPRGTLGLRSRMLTDDVLRALPAPLLLVPTHD